ncbi:MAG: nuclear transport factor 2 family protein [Bacteroidota bacterium]
MKEEILQKEEELRAAMLQADIPQLEKLIHEKLIFHIPTGELISKEMDLENYRSGKMQLQRLECKGQRLEIHEDTAIVSVEVDMSGSFEGNAFAGKFRFLRVWKKASGNWQVIAGGSSPLSS